MLRLQITIIFIWYWKYNIGSSVYAASYETSHHEAGSVCDDNASVYTGYTECEH
jgi:hypothetical protein